MQVELYDSGSDPNSKKTEETAQKLQDSSDTKVLLMHHDVDYLAGK